MKYRLVKLEKLSGNKASIYTVFLEDDQETLFDRFLKENNNSFKSELYDIVSRLNTIGHKTGAREQFFKLFEGKPGDGVCALHDKPNKKLRLYCIRYGSLIVILGGGGSKSKQIRRLQEDKKLSEENFILRQISEDIKQRIKENDIWYSNDSMDFEGNLEFNNEDYE